MVPNVLRFLIFMAFLTEDGWSKKNVTKVDSCPNSVPLFVADGSIQDPKYKKEVQKPTAANKTFNGKLNLYTPVPNPVPELNEISDFALTINIKRSKCEKFCACNSDACFVQSDLCQEQKIGVYEVVPYCEDCQCHMYLNEYNCWEDIVGDTFINIFWCNTWLFNTICLTYENGTMAKLAGLFHYNMSVANPIPKIEAISCTGCDSIRNYTGAKDPQCNGLCGDVVEHGWMKNQTNEVFEHKCCNGYTFWRAAKHYTDKGVCEEIASRWRNFYVFFTVNLATIVFAILGILIEITFIRTYFYERSLHTPYGIICIWQAFIDAILLFTIGFLEAPIMLKYDADNVKIDLPDFFKNLATFYLAIRLNFFLYYFINVSKTISMIMRTFRAGTRFFALYFPVKYKFRVNNKRTHMTCLVVVIMAILVYLPVFPFNIAYRCPEGWTYYPEQNKCYKPFYISPKQIRVKFEDAEAKCEKYGGRLTIIENVEQNRFLYDLGINFLKEKQKSEKSVYWGFDGLRQPENANGDKSINLVNMMIGLKQTYGDPWNVSTLKWTWVDDAPMESHYTNWALGEPKGEDIRLKETYTEYMARPICGEGVVGEGVPEWANNTVRSYTVLNLGGNNPTRDLYTGSWITRQCDYIDTRAYVCEYYVKPTCGKWDINRNVALENDCTIFYNYLSLFLEPVIAILCVFFDVFAIIKFNAYRKTMEETRLDPNTSSQRRQEKLMLLQNVANLIVFVLSFLPKILYVFVPATEKCSKLIYSTLYYLIDATNMRSIKRSIGHTLDGLGTLLLQTRLARVNKENTTHYHPKTGIKISVVTKTAHSETPSTITASGINLSDSWTRLRRLSAMALPKKTAPTSMYG